MNSQDVTFNGNGFSFKGNGAEYWDGEGTSGGKDTMSKDKSFGAYYHLQGRLNRIHLSSFKVRLRVQRLLVGYLTVM